MIRKNRAVVCFSGGVDSTTVLHLASNEAEVVHALSIDYGQRHKKELDKAKEITKMMKIPHTILHIPLNVFGGSPLTDKNMNVPKQADKNQGATIVPFRNMLFATLAAAYAKANDLNTIYMGTTYEDLAEYPDCRPVFFDSLNETLMLGDKIHDLIISTPFMGATKDVVIKAGVHLGVDYSKTWTCYLGEDYPCLKCDACRERMLAFRLNNMKDPIVTDEDWADYLKEKVGV
ncbi:MAG: 7-cyano-7-deazaguanine synthase QueC [Acidobacteriota bacterium]|nr:7-cyano-7-deazaguanine synthase QueC [Acidobacteriota bacterium]